MDRFFGGRPALNREALTPVFQQGWDRAVVDPTDFMGGYKALTDEQLTFGAGRQARQDWEYEGRP